MDEAEEKDTLSNKSKQKTTNFNEVGKNSTLPNHDERESCGRRSGPMVSAIDSGASGLGSSPDRGHCLVFLGNLLSQCLSPPRCINGLLVPAKLVNAG